MRGRKVLMFPNSDQNSIHAGNTAGFVNPFLFISGLSCPWYVHFLPGFQYTINLPVSCFDIDLKDKSSIEYWPESQATKCFYCLAVPPAGWSSQVTQPIADCNSLLALFLKCELAAKVRAWVYDALRCKQKPVVFSCSRPQISADDLPCFRSACPVEDILLLIEMKGLKDRLWALPSFRVGVTRGSGRFFSLQGITKSA